MNVPTPVIEPRDERAPAPGQLARVRQALGEAIAAGADGRGDPGDEGVRRVVRVKGDGEDRREGRERPVDEADHRRLDPLQQELIARALTK